MYSPSAMIEFGFFLSVMGAHWRAGIRVNSRKTGTLQQLPIPSAWSKLLTSAVRALPFS